MALTKNSIIMQCSAAGLVYSVQTKPIIPLSAVLHIHQNESLSFDECLKDTHNYPEMRVFIILWLLKPNAKWLVSSKELLFYLPLCFIMVTRVPVTKSSATCGYFLLWKSCLASLTPLYPPPMKHQSTATLKLQAHFGIALLPPDPVITAHTRHQHYYSSNHSIIIPQNTSKRQLTFQGKNKNSWIMH